MNKTNAIPSTMRPARGDRVRADFMRSTTASNQERNFSIMPSYRSPASREVGHVDHLVAHRDRTRRNHSERQPQPHTESLAPDPTRVVEHPVDPAGREVVAVIRG